LVFAAAVAGLLFRHQPRPGCELELAIMRFDAVLQRILPHVLPHVLHSLFQDPACNAAPDEVTVRTALQKEESPAAE
jgi:hypothetical protein